MSIVLRELEGRSYIHVRRKVNKVQKQRFINIDGLSREEIALKKHEAKKLDEQWRDEQGELHQESFIKHFYEDGHFKHIKVKAPDHKNGWRIGFIVNPKNEKATTCSRSIERNGFDDAFKQVYGHLLAYYRFSPKSMHARILGDIWLQDLKREYAAMQH